MMVLPALISRVQPHPVGATDSSVDGASIRGRRGKLLPVCMVVAEMRGQSLGSDLDSFEAGGRGAQDSAPPEKGSTEEEGHGEQDGDYIEYYAGQTLLTFPSIRIQ